MAGNQPHFASASLYVGDLHPDVNETMLFEVFNAVGPVASIRVCRESGTRKSLGYAYVNYHSITDAERALDTLNYTLIRGVPCRIMWSHRDPSLRRSGAGNIFVKNLDKVIDNKALYDTFSLFGNILSCKVATDEHGKSKGYGFVHYESEESGRTAIEKVNNMQIGSKTVYVGPFKRRVERIATSDTAFTNLYVKQFPSEWTEDTMRSLFSPFGEITSVAITTDNVNRRFGFVNFKSPESAPAAIAALHGKRTTPSGVLQSDSEDEPEAAPATTTKDDAATVALTGQRDVAEESVSSVEDKKPDATAAAVATDNPSLDSVENDVDKTAAELESTEKQNVVAEKSSGEKKTSGSKATLGQKSSSMTAENRLYVQRAMSKAERINMLKESFNNTHEGKQKQPGVNLYVKNLDVQVSDEVLREAFSKYGTVTSAKVMRDEAGVSKGFGFVCFAFPDEATNAVTGMHLNIFQGKPLYVGLAEKRDHRAARLQQRYRMSNMSNTRTSAHHGVGALADLAPMMMAGQPSNVLPSHMMPYPHPAASTAAAPLYYNAAAATTAPIAQPSIPPSRTALPNAAAAAAFAGGRPAATAHQMAAAWRHHDVVAPRHSYAMAPAGNIGGTTSAPPPPPGAAGSYPSYPLGPSFQQPPAGTTAAAIAANNMAAMGQNFKFTSQARNRQGFPHMHPSSTQGMPGGPHLISPAAPLNNPADVASLLTPSDMSLSAQALAGAHPQLQKQFIGEKLFPLVHKRQPELAGKITGMMLEMDNAELLSLLDSETQLQAKVDEALSVLQRHHQGTVSSSHRTTATSTTSALAPAVAAQHQQNVVPPAVDANASPAVATPQ